MCALLSRFWEGAALTVTLVFLRGVEQPCLPRSYLVLSREEVKGSIHSWRADAGCGFIDSTLSH